jgi:hypothetical protein
VILVVVLFYLLIGYHVFVALAAFITNMPIITTIGAPKTNTPIILLPFIPVIRRRGHALGTIKHVRPSNTSGNLQRKRYDVDRRGHDQK